MWFKISHKVELCDWISREGDIPIKGRLCNHIEKEDVEKHLNSGLQQVVETNLKFPAYKIKL